MVMIAEKLRVLLQVLIGGGEKAPPHAAYIPFYRLQRIGLMIFFSNAGDISEFLNYI